MCVCGKNILVSCIVYLLVFPFLTSFLLFFASFILSPFSRFIMFVVLPSLLARSVACSILRSIYTEPPFTTAGIRTDCRANSGLEYCP